MNIKVHILFLLLVNSCIAKDQTEVLKEVEKIRAMMEFHQNALNDLKKKVLIISEKLGVAKEQGSDDIDAFLSQELPIESKSKSVVKLSKTEWIKTGVSTSLTLGKSNLNDSELKELQAGGHDPNKNGFSARAVEMSLSGDIDHIFDAKLNLNFHSDNSKGSSEFEIEEAIIHSNNFIKDLDFELGILKTNFGNQNRKHAHNWTFVDQPIISNRIFGSEGLSSGGVNLSKELKDRNSSKLYFGVQNASGEKVSSFQSTGAHSHDEEHDEDGDEDEHEHGDSFVLADEKRTNFLSGLNDILYSFRYEKVVSKDNNQDIKFGASYLMGPNNHLDKKTFIGGLDLAIRKEWLRDSGEFSSYLIEAEYIHRNYQAIDEGVHGSLRDMGYFVQGLYKPNKGFGYGLRYEKAWSGGDFAEAFTLPKHDDRERFSALLEWDQSEFSKIRLQVNQDKWSHLGTKDAHSVWLAFDVFFGDHPAHKF
ncbi:MAG: hypothetical protein KC646_13165 [Candidatus Cloacimonetes bacterium]|nr:hypothetical protein [Candidatus Cloacimonadota bacterium]